MNELARKMELLLGLCEPQRRAEAMTVWQECERILHNKIRSMEPEWEVRKIFLELGVPDHLVGHPYAIAAIVQAMQGDLPRNLSQELYPRLAETFGTTGKRVERGIRHLVEATWMRGDAAVRERYFGNTIHPEKGKPTNAEFIARIANAAGQRVREKNWLS